ncbi:centromere-associated protein E isoform 2-T2 [Anableps anableps]
MAAESAVKVCVRVRPVVQREEKAASENAQSVQLFWETDKKSVRQIDDGNSSKCFTFDRVFSAEESTSQLYQDIAKPLVVSTVEGYNGTIFAYGQTSSGKTFTMMGCDRNRGVIPLAVDDVFQTIKTFPNKEFLLRVSYMEIYNETVTDLLVDSWKRKPLEIRETMNKTVYVADLTEELVTSSTQALAWIRKGEKNRHYGKTKMNQRSSRSHTIFRMILESRERSDPASGENADGAIIVSHLNLVDLAGSERASQTGAEGTRLKEGCNINLSLFTLGQVIKKLTDENQKGFTNYRDSKLTRILQNSLGGNAKTVIISTITPVSLDETLSTLQFASTAKKMKNDPHVTEVSDDGALLKRYRNEIVDLKQRLHEVSSVTQTTVMEKEVLSQLLQEKDQLQREQEDRIRNLTKLLVTGSNLVYVPKMPKRRVTWGGKMLRTHQSACDDDGISDMNETFSRKKKADRFCSMDLGEADEDFYPHWGIPEEPSDEMEMRSSVTVRSFGNSDLASPDQRCALLEKMSNLDLQLETERQQREEAVKKVEMLDGRVAELQLQVLSEALQKQEAVEIKQTTEGRLAEVEMLLQNEAKEKTEVLEKMQMVEQRFADLEMKLQNETQQKLNALLQMQAVEQKVADLERVLETEAQQKLETTAMLEFKVSELERQLEEQKHPEYDQMRKGFAESVQLCETLTSEKEMVIAERDHLKQELGMFLEHTQSLEKENAVLIQELKEKKDLKEFKSLELKVMEENENELQKEISSLKKAIESSEHQRLLLEMTLTASKKKMKAKLNRLNLQLEMETSSDPQKQLDVASDDNALLDDKVPENLLESVELERSGTSLQRELALSSEAEEAVRAQLEEHALVQTLKDQVDSLTKQIGELTEELQVVKKTRDNLQSGQAQSEQEAEQLRDLLQALKRENDEIQAKLQSCAQKENELKQQCADVTQQLKAPQAEQKQSDSERSRIAVSLEEKETELNQMIASTHWRASEKEGLLLEQNAHVQSSAEEDGNTATEVLLRTVQEELREEKQRNSDLMTASLEKESELKEHMLRLSQELQDGTKSSTEEAERLLTVVASLTAERDQLKQDLLDNVEMMIENQEELRTVLEKNREQAKQIKLLKSENISKQDGHPSKMSSQLEESQRNMKGLTEELENVRAERDQLLAEKESCTEKLRCEVTGISEKRNQLQEVLEELREEKKKLQAELEENIKMMTVLNEELKHVQIERDNLLSKNPTSQSSTEELEKLQSRLTALSEERDELQQIVEGLREEKKELRAQLEEKIEMMQCEFQQKQLLSDADPLKDEQMQQLEEVNHLRSVLQENEKLLLEKQEELKVFKESKQHMEEEFMELKNQVEMQSNSNIPQQFAEELECLKAERVSLLAERTAVSQCFEEELEKLQSRLTALSQEREELQEELAKKHEVETQLQRKTETLEAEVRELNVSVQTVTEQKRQLEEQLQQLGEKASSTEELLSAFKDELLEQRNLNSELKKTNEEKKCSLDQKITELSNNLESVEAERDFLLSEKEKNLQNHKEEREKLQLSLMALSQKRDLLQEVLVELRGEKEQLRAQLQEKMNMMSAFQEKLTQQELLIMQKQTEKEEQEATFQREMQNLQEELQLQRERRALAETESRSSQRLLNEVNVSLSSLRQQLNNVEGRPSAVRETLSHLQDSTNCLDAIFGKFQQFSEMCTEADSETPDEVLRVQCSLKHTYLTSLPKSGLVVLGDVVLLGSNTYNSFKKILGQLMVHACDYVKIFEVVVKKDLAVFEERRLQDLLLSRVDAPKYSVNIKDFQSLWNERLTELLEKRQLYQQKMASILEKLGANLTSYLSVRQAEILERVKFNEALEAAINPPVFSELERILSQEAERRRTVVQNGMMLLQVISDELNKILDELKQLEMHSDSQLREEKRKNSSLLQVLEGTHLKADLSLLQNYKQLVLQLQQAAGDLTEQLEEAKFEANNMESNHKQVIQILQTELLDTQVLVKEKENTILTLQVKLEECKKKASPNAAELENLRSKLFETEVKLASVTDKHQQEMERMKMVLSVKEESLRKLKQDLRSQQQGEESFLTGKELHARLTNPKGTVIQSSVLLEKTKLEEEVKQLQLRITELESLVTSQQVETNKWKNRAISLKGKSKADQDQDKQSSPSTPKKRPLATTSDSTLFSSPKKNCLPLNKILDSPRKVVASSWKPLVGATSLLDSPKSSFFDAGENSELLTRNCPKQFFDNSDLGIKPDAAAGADKLDLWKDEQYCKTQ